MTNPNIELEEGELMDQDPVLRTLEDLLKDIPTDSTMEATIDDDLRCFEDLLSLLPPTDPLESQLSAPTQQPTVSITTTPTATPASARSFVVPLSHSTLAVPIATASKPPPLKVSPPNFKIPLVPSNSRIKKRTQMVRP